MVEIDGRAVVYFLEAWWGRKGAGDRGDKTNVNSVKCSWELCTLWIKKGCCRHACDDELVVIWASKEKCSNGRVAVRRGGCGRLQKKVLTGVHEEDGLFWSERGWRAVKVDIFLYHPSHTAPLSLLLLLLLSSSSSPRLVSCIRRKGDRGGETWPPPSRFGAWVLGSAKSGIRE